MAMSSPAACCPDDSLPELSEPSCGRGAEMTISAEVPLDIYVTSSPSNAKSAIIIASDVFGWQSGHHRRFADQLAGKVGQEATVVIPDLFHGSPLAQPMFAKRIGFQPFAFLLGLPSMLYRMFSRDIPNEVDRDLGVLVRYLRAAGVERLSIVGFCFGAWVVARALASEANHEFACGIGVHPSLQLEKLLVKGSTDVELAKRVGATPFLLMPAAGDHANLKPGGEVCKVLAAARGVADAEVSHPFESMKHGWVTRGDDTADAEIARDQSKALERAAEFIMQHASAS